VGGAPLLNVFGGKITTYRRLAESAMEKLAPFIPDLPNKWTAGVTLPGGDFEVGEKPSLVAKLQQDYAFLTRFWAERLIRAYGTEAWKVLGDAATQEDLGLDFGATLTEAEVHWLITQEYARKAEDVVWRRTKLGLRMTVDQIAALDQWMANNNLDTAAKGDE
ncbi:MAG TPA: glycerol-3-phosphate dehydrogenase C-terminal domain-containing protein, partial [Paracoccaceae bacterium]|nr:glycerol-3-phosphate dehydrogenase C-terminal domain-containing protein [Paracoccaceae bacterium]